MKKKESKAVLVWTAALLSAHIAALFLFSILLSKNCKELAYERQLAIANRATFLFSAITILLFLLLYHKTSFALVDQQAKFLRQREQQDMPLLRYFFKFHVKKVLCRTLSFALLQIPFVLYYARNSFSYIRASMIEQFYLMDAGFYLAARSSKWGLVLCVAYFMIVDAVILFFCLLGLEVERKRSSHYHQHHS